MKARWMKFAMVAAMLFVVSSTALAFQAAAGSPAAPAAATSVWSAILLAAVNGGIVGVVGYLSQSKNPDGSHEAFDPVQLVVTIVVGAGIGAIAAWRNKSFADVETWVQNSGYVTLAEILLKMVWRNGTVKLAGVLDTLKAGGTSSNPTASAPATPPKA